MTLKAAPRPRETPDRCALRAQLRGDPMLGTAFPAARILLVEQPGPWGRAGLRESRFDPAVAADLERAAGVLGIRVLAIRRPGRTPFGTPRRWALADCRPGREALRWGRFEHDDELTADPPWTRPVDRGAVDCAGGRAVRPVFLVCAHSKHDACCALRGRHVAAALAEQAPGRVFECSHLGGERFAANVLVAPLGLLYGRVLPFAAHDFVSAADRGEVVEALLRGRVGLVPVAQAALAAAHAQLAVRGANELRVREVRTVAPGHCVVRISTPHGAVDVTVVSERSAAHHLTCRATGPAPFLAHRPVSMEPAV